MSAHDTVPARPARPAVPVRPPAAARQSAPPAHQSGRPAHPTGSEGRFPPPLTENVPSFAERQGGHVTRSQLLALGIGRRTVDRWIASGHLIRVYRGVYAVGYRSRNPIERAHAAVLAGGEGSALADGTALVVWGIWKRWAQPLEIVIAGDRRPSGLVAHRSKNLLPRDITVVNGLRVTSAARTLLDTAQRLTEKQRTRAVNDLRLRNLVTLDALADVIERNPTRRGVTLLRPLLEIAQAEPSRSKLEDAFMKLITGHALPVPQINVHVGGHRVDAYFAQHRLIVELDGWASHRTRTAFVNDRRQDADILAATGIPTVRLVYDDTLLHPDATAARLSAILKARA
jgi:very-short-patch-repair endonuclease